MSLFETGPLPEVIYLDELSEDCMFTWNWPVVARRVYDNNTLLVTKSAIVYHALRRTVSGKFRIRRRKHEQGYVYQITKKNAQLQPITTRSGETAQSSNRGVFLKIATDLITDGKNPSGRVVEVENYKKAFAIRTLFYLVRKRTNAKVAIALRVKQANGSYMPLKQTKGYEKQRITLFSYPKAKKA